MGGGIHKLTHIYNQICISLIGYRFEVMAELEIHNYIVLKLKSFFRKYIVIFSWLYRTTLTISSVQFSSVQYSHSVGSGSLQPHGLQHARLSFEHHQLPELAQTHVHRVGDAIQPSHPLMSPSPPVFNVSQHQGIFQGVSSSYQMAKVLELQLQHQSFQWIFRTDFI